MNLDSYGKEKRPVLVVWNGNDPLSVLETILFREIEEIVGYQQIHQFTNIHLAQKHLSRHTGLRNLSPTLVVVFAPEKEKEIENFFQQYSADNYKKLLVCVTDKCKMPHEILSHDETLTLRKTALETEDCEQSGHEQQDIRNFLTHFLGEPLPYRMDPERLVSEFGTVS